MGKEPKEAKPKRSRSSIGRRNRQRGQEHERNISNDLTAAGATEVEKSREYHKPKPWDVVGGLGRKTWRIQCKRRKSMKMIEEAEEALRKDDIDLYNIWIDNHQPVVVMLWTEFLKIMEERDLDA